MPYENNLATTVREPTANCNGNNKARINKPTQHG